MPEASAGRPRRPRDAAATRAALLAAAVAAFARDGYAGVGLRDVAAAANVDAALVSRYFGSKQGLFAEAIGRGFDVGPVLASGRADLGGRLARLVVRKDEAPDGDGPLLLLLRSAADAGAAPLLRDALDDQFVRPLARWLGGEHAEERAGLIAATLLGLAAMRHVLRSEPLAAAEAEVLVALVAPILQSYVDGTPHPDRMPPDDV